MPEEIARLLPVATSSDDSTVPEAEGFSASKVLDSNSVAETVLLCPNKYLALAVTAKPHTKMIVMDKRSARESSGIFKEVT